MNIVIPMAGQGERFSRSGFLLPKPLISIKNKEMYRHAVDCLPLNQAQELIFIVMRNSYLEQLVNSINQHYSHYNTSIVILESMTQGQAETVLKCKDFLNLNQSTLIHNCDTQIDLSTSWMNVINTNVDGSIILFESTEDRWSFVTLDASRNYITSIKEKEVISSYATTGTYFFSDTYQLMKNIEKIIQDDLRENNEYYLSTVYQIMINDNQKVIPIMCSDFKCFGTPQDLVDSLNCMLLNSAHG